MAGELGSDCWQEQNTFQLSKTFLWILWPNQPPIQNVMRLLFWRKSSADFAAEFSLRSSVNFNNEWKWLPLRTRMFMATCLMGIGEYYLVCYYIQSVWIRSVKGERYQRLIKQAVFIDKLWKRDFLITSTAVLWEIYLEALLKLK